MLNHQGLQLWCPIENITALLDSFKRADIKHPHEHNHNAVNIFNIQRTKYSLKRIQRSYLTSRTHLVHLHPHPRFVLLANFTTFTWSANYLPCPPMNLKNWRIHSGRPFQCHHMSQSLWTANQKETFPCACPFRDLCIIYILYILTSGNLKLIGVPISQVNLFQSIEALLNPPHLLSPDYHLMFL